MYTNLLGASSGDLALSAGKSWGTYGYGNSNGKTTAADTVSGSNIAQGVTFSKYELGKSTCVPHYMITQVGVVDYGK